MKKLESSLTNMVLVLTGVAVIMGGILAYVNYLTEGPISEQKAKALADGIKNVMCVSDIKVAKTAHLYHLSDAGRSGQGSWRCCREHHWRFRRRSESARGLRHRGKDPWLYTVGTS